MEKKIKVLIVDDSGIMRKMLTSILSQSPLIEVIGAAENAYSGRDMIKKHNPDVLTLDVEMPGLNGIEFLERIMRLRPMPVVMVSSITQRGSKATIESLEIGAVDFISKPKNITSTSMEVIGNQIIQKVIAASKVNFDHVRGHAKPVKSAAISQTIFPKDSNIIAIGASTGGVAAISEVLKAVKKTCPPIVIVQHMPPVFTRNFANRLNGKFEIEVKEAEEGDVLKRGHCYISPGDKHMTIKKLAGQFVCHLQGGNEVTGHKPSVDVLFRSVAEVYTKPVTALILTGMGRDGADGLKVMKNKGFITIGQDEESSVVYGMARSAREVGALEKEMSIQKIGIELGKL
jgi:two-component system chemotaxis response regulator CheB